MCVHVHVVHVHACRLPTMWIYFSLPLCCGRTEMCAYHCISGHMKSFPKEVGIIWIKAILWSSDLSQVPTDRERSENKVCVWGSCQRGWHGALTHPKDLGGWWPKAGCHCCLGRWYWGIGVEHHCRAQLWLSLSLHAFIFREAGLPGD